MKYFKKSSSFLIFIIVTACSLFAVEVACFYLLKNGYKVGYVYDVKREIESFDAYNDILYQRKEASFRSKQLSQYVDEWGISKFENADYEYKTHIPNENQDWARIGEDGIWVHQYFHTLKKNYDREITLYEKKSNNVVYRARYTTNSLGWRITSNENNIKKGPSLVFMGCSFIFGEGLNNNQTFPYLLSERSGLQTYNLGVGASSPSWMLQTILESKINIINPADKNDKILFYVYIDDHFNRVIANTKYLENEHRFNTEPYFYLENNELKHKTTFSEMNLFKGYIIRLLSKSNFMKVMRLSYPRIGDEQVNLFASIVHRIKILSMKNDSTIKDFYVVIWPGNKYKNSELINSLSKYDIKTINYGDLNLSYLLRNRDTQLKDGHPSALTNDLLAFLLSKDLSEILNTDLTNKADQN